MRSWNRTVDWLRPALCDVVGDVGVVVLFATPAMTI